MKYYELDQEEKEISQAFKKGQFKRVKNFKKVKEGLLQAAKNTSTKAKNINIRISYGDLLGIKREASKEGLPYQTFIASILHKYINQGLVCNSNQVGMIMREKFEGEWGKKVKER